LRSSYQKFAKGVVIIGITNLLLLFLGGLILLPLLTKTLGARDYGIWAQVDVTIQLVLVIAGLGLPFALSRFLAAETDKVKLQEGFYSAFTIVTLVTLAASILLIVLAEPIAKAFFEGMTEIVRITSLIILVWSLDIMFLSMFRARLQMLNYGIFMIATKFGEIGLIAYFVLNGHGILSVVLCVLAIRTLILLILFFYVKSQVGIKRPSFCNTREYLSFSLPLVPNSVFAWLVSSSDRYVIGYFLGAASVGVYSAGYALGVIPATFAVVLAFVLSPTLSKLYDEGKNSEVKTYLSYSLKYYLALAIPFVFGALVLAEPALRLFTTAEIASQGYFVVPLVALGVLFLGAYGVIAHILVLVKRTKIMALVWVIAAVANLGLNIALVPHLGILGAAIAVLVAYLLTLGIGSYYSFKELTFTIDWRFILKSLVASAMMALIIWSMQPETSLSVIAAVLVGVAIYVVALFLMRGFRKEEVSFFRGLVQRGDPAVNSDDKAK